MGRLSVSFVAERKNRNRMMEETSHLSKTSLVGYTQAFVLPLSSNLKAEGLFVFFNVRRQPRLNPPLRFHINVISENMSAGIVFPL